MHLFDLLPRLADELDLYLSLRLPEQVWLLSRAAVHTLSVSHQHGMNNYTIITGLDQSDESTFKKHLSTVTLQMLYFSSN